MSILDLFRSEKKTFFIRKMREVRFAIYDMEFKIEKAREVREGVRVDRDRAVENIRIINDQLEADKQAKDKMPKEKHEEMEAALKAHTDNVSRYERQMQMIDDEVNGAQPSEDNPRGTQGLSEYLAGYNELLAMLKKKYKTL